MIISRTPLRMSFAGGGSDLAAYYKTGFGAVVSSALDRYIYITVNRKFDELIRVSYSQTEIVESVDELQHNIIRECLRIVGIEKGVEIVYMGDIPLGSAGTGLGSSSSLTVGVLNALYAYKGEHVSAERLAREACEIEIDILNCPIGKQDQYIAAYGGLQYVRFNRDESVFVDPVICQNIIRCDTGLTVVCELTPDDVARGLLDIGVGPDDCGRLTTKFQSDRCQVFCRRLHHDLADCRAAREENVVKRKRQ